MPILFTTFFVVLILIAFTKPASAASQILINEFLVEPDSDQEIELYNASNTQIDISGYFLDDDSGSQKYTIPTGTILGSGETKSFKSSSFNLNRASADVVRLLNGSDVLDSKTYDKSPGSGKSIGRTQDGFDTWLVFDTPSFGKSNNNATGIPIASPTPSPTPSAKSSLSKSSSPSPQKSSSPFTSSSPQLVKSSSPITQKLVPEILSVKTESSSQASPQTSPQISPSPQQENSSQKPNTKIAASLTGGGLILIGLSIGLYLWFNKSRNQNSKKDSDE